jgi:hypothetical protein
MVSRVRSSPSAHSIINMLNLFTQINPTKLIDGSYIFESSPNSEGLYINLAIFFGLMIITACVMKLFIKPTKAIRKKFIDKLFYLLLIIGILGLIWVFARFEEIAYLRSRITIILLFCVFIAWAMEIVFYRSYIVPKELIKIRQKEKFEKYLPHRQTGRNK